MPTIPVIEQSDGSFAIIDVEQLTSLNGERVTPLAVLLHESWTAADRAEFGVYLAIEAEVPPGKVRVSSGFERQGDQVLQVVEVEDAPVVIPASVTPRQLRLALLSAGRLAQVQAFVDSGYAPQEAVISWEYATEFLRSDPMLNQLAGALTPPMGGEEIDQLFLAASQIR